MNNISPNVTPELDPRWEWVEERTYCQAGPSYVRGTCNHLEVVDVESVVDPDVVLACLCLTCDMQLPAGYVSPASPPTITELADALYDDIAFLVGRNR